MPFQKQFPGVTVEYFEGTQDVIKARSAEFGTQFTETGDCLEIVRQTVRTEVSKAA